MCVNWISVHVVTDIQPSGMYVPVFLHIKYFIQTFSECTIAWTFAPMHKKLIQ